MKKYLHISNEEREELLKEFCEALSVLKNFQEVMNFLTDLLTREELVMLARRIKIAKLLIEGKDYREIESLLKVGTPTIARVNRWLSEGGEGFRLIAERTRREKPKPPSSVDYAMRDWRKFRKRYPLVFWPQLLIEDIIKAMNKRQREKVRHAIERLDRKSQLYKQINRILKT
jgi:TrpR-related protein YerC/YecD